MRYGKLTFRSNKNAYGGFNYSGDNYLPISSAVSLAITSSSLVGMT